MNTEDEAILQQAHHEGQNKEAKAGSSNTRNGKPWWQMMDAEQLAKHASTMDTADLHKLTRELKQTGKEIQGQIEKRCKEDDESWWWRAHDARNHVSAKSKVIRQELWQRQRVDFSLRKTRKQLRWAIKTAIAKLEAGQEQIAVSVLRDSLIATEKLEHGLGIGTNDDEE